MTTSGQPVTAIPRAEPGPQPAWPGSLWGMVVVRASHGVSRHRRAGSNGRRGTAAGDPTCNKMQCKRRAKANRLHPDFRITGPLHCKTQAVTGKIFLAVAVKEPNAPIRASRAGAISLTSLGDPGAFWVTITSDAGAIWITIASDYGGAHDRQRLRGPKPWDPRCRRQASGRYPFFCTKGCHFAPFRGRMVDVARPRLGPEDRGVPAPIPAT